MLTYIINNSTDPITHTAIITNTYSESVPAKNYSGLPGTVQSYVVGTGGATVEIQVSLDEVAWVLLGTIIHATTTLDSGGIAISQNWNFARARITAVGANTTVTVIASF